MEDLMLFFITFTAIVFFVMLGQWDLKKYGCAFGGAEDGNNYDGPDSGPFKFFTD